MAIFPGEPGSASFIGAKDDRGGGDNWSYKTCKTPVKSSSPTNQHLTFYRQDALPVAQPKVSKHWRLKYHILRTCSPQALLGVFQLCLWPLIVPGYLWGGLPCLSSTLWCPAFESKHLPQKGVACVTWSLSKFWDSISLHVVSTSYTFWIAIKWYCRLLFNRHIYPELLGPQKLGKLTPQKTPQKSHKEPLEIACARSLQIGPVPFLLSNQWRIKQQM